MATRIPPGALRPPIARSRLRDSTDPTATPRDWRSLRRHLKWALTTAFIGGAIEALFKANASTPPPDLFLLAWDVAPSAAAGFAVGWLLDLAREATEAAGRLTRLDSGFLHYLERLFQQEPYGLMLASSRHTGVVGALLRKSLESGYHRVTGVHEHDYLLLLQQAVAASDSFFGVQRHPVHWFFGRSPAAGGDDRSEGQGTDDTAEEKKRYLSTLRERRMESKIRVFVIRDEDLSAMRADLKDPALMQSYWEATGDVRTFWIGEAKLRDEYGIRGRLDDFALFDDQLLVKYDRQHRLVEFDVTDGTETEHKVRKALRAQLQSGLPVPFEEVTPLADGGVQQAATPGFPRMLRGFAQRQVLYEDLPSLLSEWAAEAPKRIDLLQFTGHTAVPLLNKCARAYPGTEIRLALAEPELSESYDADGPSYHRRRVYGTISDAQRLRRERQFRAGEAAGRIEVRCYSTSPGVSAVIVDDRLAILSWYRTFQLPGEAGVFLRGHDCAAVLAAGEPGEMLVEFARSHFDDVWRSARAVGVGQD